MMNEKVYDAFLSLGMAQEKAQSAAVALASSDERFVAIEKKLIQHDGQFERLSLELRLTMAISFVSLGAVLGVYKILFDILAKLPA